MLIPWLLKYDGYPPGVVVALLLHGILIYIFMPKQFDPADQVRIEPASIVVASAQQSPQRMRRLQQQTQRQQAEAAREQQRQRDEQRKRDEAAAAERQRVAKENQRREADRKRAEDQERERQRAETERQRVAQEQQERQREQERQRQLQEQAAADAARQAAAAAATQAQGVEQQMVAQYAAIIRDLVSRAWSRSPDARNGMVAIVQIRLTPTGEILSSTIVQSSGSAAFDRSVQQAVDRVGNISELQGMPTPIFERYFRNFNLEFRPEDLLR